jgi:hypothetical protein
MKPPTSLFQRGTAGVIALAARAKKLSELAGALPVAGQFFTRAGSLYSTEEAKPGCAVVGQVRRGRPCSAQRPLPTLA